VIVQLNGVWKSYGSQVVLRDVSFQVNPSEKVGLIGPNGAGKTTLLNVISRALEIDSGVVNRKSNLQIGRLDQIPDFHGDTSVLEEGFRALESLRSIEREMRELEGTITVDPVKAVLERYSQLQHEFELWGGYSYRARTEAALLGVGFTKAAFSRRSASLSGGEKNRLALANLLLSDAQLLLLDEPTNHLDIPAIEWLETFLRNTTKAVIAVSHDRFFLDRVVTRILEVTEGRVADYAGNYSAYIRQQEARLAQQQNEFKLQKDWIAEQEDYIRRNIAGQKTKQAQSRRKFLARTKRLEAPKATNPTVRFRFFPVERTGRCILMTRGVTVGYGQTSLVGSIQFEVQRGERWAILGANGSGKTTLLKTLTGLQSAIEGEINWSDGLDIGYYDQQLQDLNPASSVIEEIRVLDSAATDGELRGYLARFLFTGDDVYKSVANLSGGEKSRLVLSKIIYEHPQVLALDEPTNHLDIASREALENALLDYPGTILFVTHDRYLVQKIASHLIYIDDGTCRVLDRLSAFEEWLVKSRAADVTATCAGSTKIKTATGISKNRLDRLRKEAADIEEQIEAIEASLRTIEDSFQNPDPASDWQEVHRRYDDLKRNLDRLYTDLNHRWKALDGR